MTNYISYFYYPVLSGFLPILIASTFSLLAYQNVRRIVRRQIPLVRRRLDQQLTYTIQRMYTYITKINQTNMNLSVINSSIGFIAFAFFNLNYAISFYLFLATSPRFRRQVKYVLVKIFWRRWKLWYSRTGNQVLPIMGDRSDIDNGEIE